MGQALRQVAGLPWGTVGPSGQTLLPVVLQQVSSERAVHLQHTHSPTGWIRTQRQQAPDLGETLS